MKVMCQSGDDTNKQGNVFLRTRLRNLWIKKESEMIECPLLVEYCY